ncbi:MAG: hypothetical protein ACRDTU_23345, partial [Micromonosporaceae bacterium]
MRTAGWDPVRGQWILIPYGGYFRRPPRPTYREPHPVRGAAVWAGVGATFVWFLFWILAFASIAWNARSYAWSTIIAGLAAWGVAAALGRYGDRGVAVGVAATSAVAVGIAGLIVGVRHFGG